MKDHELAVSDELLELVRRATIGEFDIHSEIARGGMAAVYLAHEIALDRKVALKVMSPGLTFGPGMVERFKREARTAAALSHPNIIPVYAVREVDGLCFFVMKLVQGTTLDSVISQVGQAPFPMVEAVIAQVGGALGYAHRNGVIHRDIKPGNIMIDDEGWVVVTDFGIAKVVEAEGLTMTGMAVGTPTYMSPEQGSGGEVTAAADQYSLGVIGYEMLTGQRPFHGSNPMALIYAHNNADPAPIESLRPDCPEPLRVAVMRMLAKDPAGRWPTLEQAVKAVGGVSVETEDPTRSMLVELAKTGSSARLVARAQTPRSPVPFMRKSGEGTGASAAVAANRPWIRAVGALVVASGLVTATYFVTRPTPGIGPPPAAEGPSVEAAAEPAPTETTPVVGAGQAVVAPPRAPAAAVLGRELPPAVPSPVRPPAQDTAVLSSAAVTAASDSARPADSVLTRVSPATAASEPSLSPAPSAVPLAADPRPEIEAVLRRYGDALESGDIARVKRAFPGLPAGQEDGMAAFYSSGSTLQTVWRFQDLFIAGDTATARIVGANRVTAPRARATEQPVDLRVKLVRQSGTWRLVQVIN